MTDLTNYLSVTLPDLGTYDCTVEQAAKIEKGYSKRQLAVYLVECHYGRDRRPQDHLKYWLAFPKAVLVILAGSCGLWRDY